MATDANQLGNSPGTNSRRGLGLGMGLGAGQRQAFRRAVNNGTLSEYLNMHPNQQAAFIQAQGRNPNVSSAYLNLNQQRRSQRAQDVMNQHDAIMAQIGPTHPGNSAPSQAANPQPAVAPTKGTGMAKGAVGPAGMAPPSLGQMEKAKPAPGPNQGIPSNETGPAATGYQDALTAQYGASNPFGMRGNYSDPNNPIYAAAKRNYDQTMAAQRARFGASGLGNSGREALAEGEGAANLAAQIAQIGEQSFQADKGTGLQAMLGAAQNQNQANQLALQANQQLSGLGTGLTGIGSQEQGIPNLGELMSFLGAFSNSLGSGSNRTKGANGFAFKQ